MKKKVLNGKKTLTNDLIDIVSEKVQTPGERILEIPLEKIREKQNVRKEYNEESIREMANSIKETKGKLISPITVMKSKDGFYDILVGHRRFKGMVYLHEQEQEKYFKIQCIVKDKENFSESEIILLQTIENIQRDNLTTWELAESFRVLRNAGFTIKQIAQKVGKSEGYVKNVFSSVKSLNENEELKELVKSNAGVTLADLQEVKVLPAKYQLELITQRIKGKIKNREDLRTRVWKLKEEISAENKEYRQHREKQKYKLLDYSVRYTGCKVKSFPLNEDTMTPAEAKDIYEQMLIVTDKLLKIIGKAENSDGGENEQQK